MKFHSSVFLIVIYAVFSCKPKSNSVWDITVNDVTSSSSPNAIDLNNDGIKDLVLGAGGEEWSETEKGILAINGKDGTILWTAPARNQIVGTAVFADLNGDKTPDVIIGGRSAELQARNGINGDLLWEAYSKKGKFIARTEGWYNFFNAQIINDINSDGVSEILISNGGDAIIPAGMKYRPPGKLLVFSGKSGEILASDFMPDGHETYFSPLVLEEGKDPKILYGTGGESVNGHLYVCKLSDLRNKNLKNSTIIDSTILKGYVAPPILVDFNGDGLKDILVNTSEGHTKLFDGKSLKLIWKTGIENTETYSQPAVGQFCGNDNTPDVMVTYAFGTYPDFSSTERCLIDGKTGKIIKKFTEKSFIYSSPLVADLDQNGFDEVIFNTVNDTLIENRNRSYYHLKIYDFKNNKIGILADKKIGGSFASTPWLGDLDNDNVLDLIYSGSPSTSSYFPGTTTYEKPEIKLFVHRYSFPNLKAKSVKWGSYMGKEGKSKI